MCADRTSRGWRCSPCCWHSRRCSRSFFVTRRSQFTTRYAAGIEQLANQGSTLTRVGGIHALASVARDSPHDHAPIMDVLTLFVRTTARPVDAPGMHVDLAHEHVRREMWGQLAQALRVERELPRVPWRCREQEIFRRADRQGLLHALPAVLGVRSKVAQRTAACAVSRLRRWNVLRRHARRA